MKVLVLGAGGHAQVVADALLCAHRAGSVVVPIAFLDDASHLHGQVRLGLPVLGPFQDVDKVPHDAVIIGVGDNQVRRSVYEHLKRLGECFVTAIHPRSTIATDVQIGEGTLVCAGVVVNTGTVIGHNVILNTACSVDHHNQIGNYVHIAPGAHSGGDVVIGDGTLIGIGATVMPQRQVGNWSIVGAGAVVTTNLPAHAKVVGVPARPQAESMTEYHRSPNSG